MSIESSQMDKLEELISSSLFLIDLFTSTKTLTNENSTKAALRFSCSHDRNINYFCMNFDMIFLDDSRLKNTNLREESNFIIFYFLLDIMSETLKKEIGLNNFDDYSWIKNGIEPQWNSNSNKDYKRQFFNSLNMIGFDQAEILVLLKILASIILLEKLEKEQK
jgi:myosin heavy subunit